jgi:gliding motility-associated-like protein
LLAPILITPPVGFGISTDNINFSSTLTIGSSGNLSAQTVYIRLAATTPVGNDYSGNIQMTTTGATEVDLFMPVSTVTPALLAIIADDKTKTFDTPNPILTATYVGFVNLETPASLTIPPVLTTTAVTTSPVGLYPISVSGATSPNYTINYIAGTLTVEPTEQSLVIPNTFTPNGDGINDTWDIKFLAFYTNCSVDIFTRWGQQVYSSIGYGIPWNGTYKGAALPVGTYYYVINLKNGQQPLSGFVAIIR